MASTLNLGSLDLDPKQETEYVNPYSETGQINIANETKEVIDDITLDDWQDLTQDEKDAWVENVLSEELETTPENSPDNPEIQEIMKKEGKSFKGVIDDVKSKLPAGVNLKELSKKASLADIKNNIDNVKNGMSVSKFAGKVPKPALFTKSMELLSKGGPALKKLSDYGVKVPLPGGILGDALLSGNLTEGTFAVAALEEALKKSSDIKVGNFLGIPALKISKYIENFIVREAFELCASYGSHIACADIVRKYSSNLTPAMRFNALIKITRRYRIKYERFEKGSWKAGADFMVANFDVISPGWHDTIRRGDTIRRHNVFIKGNQDCLTVLQYNDRTMDAAVMQLDLRLVPEEPKIIGLDPPEAKPYINLADAAIKESSKQAKKLLAKMKK